MIGLVIARLAMLIGLFVSTGLLVDVYGPGAASCSYGGCDDVLHSSWSKPLGIPLPLLGFFYFSTLLVLSLLQGERPALLFRTLAILGAAGGVGLIVVQAVVLHQICPYCLVVDSAAMAIALSILTGFNSGPLPANNKWMVFGWITTGLLLASAGGAFWFYTRKYEPPQQIVDMIDPERVTIVAIGNPRCGHCRYMHGVLDRIEQDLGKRVKRVTIMLPTPDKPEGKPVTRALQCLRKQNLEQAFLGYLFRLDNGDIPADDCESVAVRLKAKMPEYDSCIVDPNLDDLVGEEEKWLKKATPRGIPAVWIDGELQIGLKGLPRAQMAVDQAFLKREFRESHKIKR